jgi:hypothetical protein
MNWLSALQYNIKRRDESKIARVQSSIPGVKIFTGLKNLGLPDLNVVL